MGFQTVSPKVNEISIHAPARGATRVTLSAVRRDKISIHAPARGATNLRCSNRTLISYFNPRSREGSDPLPMASFPFDYHFNPRSREGSDGVFSPFSIFQTAISIHAPARGATCSLRSLSSKQQFQSTLPRGERHKRQCYFFCSFVISIHAPARGATPKL